MSVAELIENPAGVFSAIGPGLFALAAIMGADLILKKRAPLLALLMVTGGAAGVACSYIFRVH
jgi:hypothetical protein